MEKKILLAISLSLIVVIIWSSAVARFYHKENKEVTESPSSEVSLTDFVSSPVPPPVSPSLYTFQQDKYDLLFDEASASINEVVFKDYQSYKFSLQQGFALNAQPDFVFSRQSVTPQGISFIGSDKDKKIVKRFTMSDNNYYMEVEIEAENTSSAPVKANLGLILGLFSTLPQKDQARYQDITIVSKDKGPMHLTPNKNQKTANVRFVGLRDRYFCAIAEPVSLDIFMSEVSKTADKNTAVNLVPQEITLDPGQKIGQKYRVYLGPQDPKTINNIDTDWSAVLYYGTFNVISHILLQILDFLFSLVKNWGLAIIIFSLLLYFITFPLSFKQMHSMKQMQSLQPKIEELRSLYKDNPQRLNKEIMELYRENKVNPLGGCLPMLLQIPIFFALYQALIRSIALKGAPFLWIKDLSEPDRLFRMDISGFKLPIIGNDINILPILMAIIMFFQQKQSLATSSGNVQQQKMMMIIFPIMFGFIFYHMPSGLVLYWLINSTLMFVFQSRLGRAK